MMSHKYHGAAVAFLAALSGIAFLAPVRSELILPQTDAEAPHQEVWRNVFERIPRALRPRKDVVVREVSDWEMDELVAEDEQEASRDDGSVVDGMFFKDRRGRPTITLRRSLPRTETGKVFAHEIGHLVWDTHLSERERRAFAEDYREAKRDRRLVTRYAGESVEEGFGEAFAFYVLKPDVLERRDPLAYAFFERICEDAAETRDDDER